MGITQQRLINLVDAARDYEQALNTLISRIHLQLSNEPTSLPLQILSAITPTDLLDHPTQTPVAVAVEAENIRLTRAHNDQRRTLAKRRLVGAESRQSSPPTIPDLEDYLFQSSSLAEKLKTENQK